ncbi:MAG: 2-amino-4-hydroxy-6-hydroxymethyldihydropteridine diphosphokinase [Candidatus Saganbacteria bacterium]|nr:2-amino-4-hydroxy-6-hydroxymethyldihydropteridine diphosphokinase [Candidatus Saganbacteria bacterium]
MVKKKKAKREKVKKLSAKGRSASGGKPRKKVVAKKAKGSRKKGPIHAYLSLGSNVGEREEYIEQAIFILKKSKGIKVIKKSPNYETQAEGIKNQPPFINAAVEIETTLPPHPLLDVLEGIENTLGREREIEWGPRTMDIDILFYGNEVVSDDKLQIPHPLLHERIFVLMPLAEIAPHFIHPVLEKTIADLYEEKKLEHSEKYDDELPGFKDVKRGVPDDYERW